MKQYSVLLCALGLLVTTTQASPADDIKPLIQFLISDKLLIKSKDGLPVPLSYYTGDSTDISKYFGDYLCAPAHSCAVTDSLYTAPYAILGHGLPPYPGNEQDKKAGEAQLERTDMKYGADIYDAATWQIALALAAKQGVLDKNQAATLIDNQLTRIMNSNNRAIADNFQYGYQQSIADPKKAFTYRMLATNFHNKDPFVDTTYQSGLAFDYDATTLSQNDPEHHSPEFFEYISTWSDFKPITGENAWAQLIGPLQAESLLTGGKISADSKALNNAIDSLYAFSAMQSGIGAFYYAPGGSQGNQGPIPTGEISIENNFSTLGGLQILKQSLSNTEQTPRVQAALATIDIMLNGGTTVNGIQTRGLLSFFYLHAFDAQKGVFYTHGQAPNPADQQNWIADTSSAPGAMAIDVNTWGIASLGAETIDNWYGKNTAYTLWKNVRDKGGYFNKGQLWGVGYTLNNREENIMSAEWTAGAINAVDALIPYYSQKKADPKILASLKADLKSMTQGIQNLRNDQYLKANFSGATPITNFVTVLPSDGQAYLYASKRFAIPFGWYANTLPSTTSNAWVIMNKLNYNPFQAGGKLAGEDYPIPR